MHSSEKYLYHERDLLTGLYTHSTLLSLLSEKFSDQVMGILYMEFDDLARFNHTFGFDIDDQLLIALSKSISALLDYEIFARVGTYRFAIAVPDADKKSLQLLAQKIIHLLREPFSIGENMFYVTATIGINLSSKTDFNAYTLLKYAENTMKQLQNDGMNHIGFYHEEKNTLLKRELQLMRDLPSAIDMGEFYFVYQPQYSHQTGTFTGAEILTRWKHREFGEVSAETFIPLAEKSGMIIPLTIQILIEASRMFKVLASLGREDFSLSVNISPQVLMEKTFLDTIYFLLEQYDLNGKKLTFEILESTIPKNMDSFVLLLHKLRDSGIHIAIDDYGTGHTSLRYLMEFPVDYLKVDRSFVRDVHNNYKTFLLFKTIIDMAEALELKVIAEGVEVEEEDSVLQDFKMITVQGYLYGKPVRAEKFLNFLTSPESP